MALSEELTRFVREGLRESVPRDEIEKALLEAGWPVDQVRLALARFADLRFPVPVPRPAPYVSAREAFIYLVLFSTLYLSAYSLGTLIFQLINGSFPDPALDPAFAAEATRRAIRWSVSMLIVAFPVFALVAWRNSRTVAADPNRRLSKVRRWLTYLTLFVAASVLIGDVTTLIYNLLGGELTTRFILKVLTIGAIAGSIFGYFLTDVRKEEVAS